MKLHKFAIQINIIEPMLMQEQKTTPLLRRCRGVLNQFCVFSEVYIN